MCVYAWYACIGMAPVLYLCVPSAWPSATPLRSVPTCTTRRCVSVSHTTARSVMARDMSVMAWHVICVSLVCLCRVCWMCPCHSNDHHHVISVISASRHSISTHGRSYTMTWFISLCTDAMAMCHVLSCMSSVSLCQPHALTHTARDLPHAITLPLSIF